MPKLLFVALVVVIAPACLAPDRTATRETIAQATSCPKTECGSSGNSPVIDGVYFWNLHSGGHPNAQHVAIKSVRRADNTPLRLVAGAPGDRLVGVDPITNLVIASNAQLENTKIDVSIKDKDYRIRIGHVSTSLEMEPFWVDPALIETYEFYYAPFDDLHHERPLCSLANTDPHEPMIRAIVFEGDIYNPETKDIAIGPLTTGWFNVACQNGAPYKMHKIGHTSVAQTRLGIITSLDKRRAMLNAWTMNACGTGTAFTHPGEPITIRELPNLLPASSEYTAPSVSIEAVWGPDKALCLSTPRLWEEDSDILSKIQEECGGKLPPSCEGFPWPAIGYVLTGNPAEPAQRARDSSATTSS